MKKFLNFCLANVRTARSIQRVISWFNYLGVISFIGEEVMQTAWQVKNFVDFELVPLLSYHVLELLLLYILTAYLRRYTATTNTRSSAIAPEFVTFFKVIQFINFDTNRKPVSDFILVNTKNLYCISHGFQVSAQYWSNYRFWQVWPIFNALVFSNLYTNIATNYRSFVLHCCCR